MRCAKEALFSPAVADPLRAALIRVLNVYSETMPPLHTAASRSSLLTTRSRFRIIFGHISAGSPFRRRMRSSVRRFL